MPTYVNPQKCKGNGVCMEICPSDIMLLNKETNQAFNREPDMCWECLSCVKACPEHAISVRSYADIAPMLAELSVIRDEKSNIIQWEIKYRNQATVKKFEFNIRTTPWGSIELPRKEREGDGWSTLGSELLCGEDKDFNLTFGIKGD